MGIELAQRPLLLLACAGCQDGPPRPTSGRSGVRWKAINKIRLKMSVELLPS